MFTGIIEETGTLKNITRGTRSGKITVSCRQVLEGTRIGDSIAVNGICLTVTERGGDWFSADATPETFRRTSLGRMRTGEFLNLERALSLQDRLGGHLVSGHIDGTGRVISAGRDENAVNFWISFIPSKMKYILEKGSVAVDGISLTVTERRASSFSVSVIPHTVSATNLLKKHAGDVVNIECDCVGKYIEQLFPGRRDGLFEGSTDQKGMKDYNGSF